MSTGSPSVTNVIIAGLGGQGVILASDILADAAFHYGLDVKKAEVHGMSQRGGSVNSDVRFGPRVYSPMVPDGDADFLVVLDASQVDPNYYRLKSTGRLLVCTLMDGVELPNPKTLNVAMLGVLSASLSIPEKEWEIAIKSHMPEKLHSMNLLAFQTGRTWFKEEGSHA